MHVDAEGAPIDSQTRTLINSINADSSFDDVGRVVKEWKSSWHHYAASVEQLSIQLLRRRLRLKAIEILPADEAAQRHLTAAQESEEQQEDRVLTRQRGLSLGATAELLVNSSA